MKKLLLLASALTGFAFVAEAQEATTIKTTTVQYQVPTCSNCRTTTQVRTTYPEPEPVCNTCQQVVAQPVVMKKKEQKKVGIKCHENSELGIRNPLFVLKEGQFSIQQVDGVFKEPKGRKGEPPAPRGTVYGEYLGYSAYGQVVYGLTDKWSLHILGGKTYSRPKTKQYRAAQIAQGQPPAPIPHSSSYDATLATYYHVLDLCHLDVLLGVEGTWHRLKTKMGDLIRRVNSWGAGPAVKVGSNWGWFTPYVNASYMWGRHQNIVDPETGKKEWDDNDGLWVNPGLYIQPSKWYAFDFSVDKTEHRKEQWNAGFDIYPYKNIVFGAQFNSRRPFKHPMDMFGVSGVAKVVF